jgi:rRNA maturation endonuclease Nob1
MNLFKKTITKICGDYKRVHKCTRCGAVNANLTIDICWSCGSNSNYFVDTVARHVTESVYEWWKPFSYSSGEYYWEESPYQD